MKHSLVISMKALFLIVYLTMLVWVSSFAQINPRDVTHLKITYDRATIADTLLLRFYQNLLDKNPIPHVDSPLTMKATMDSNGYYSFDFNSGSKFGYCYVTKILNKSDSPKLGYGLLSDQLVKTGDSIIIHIKFHQKHDGTPLVIPMNLDYTFDGPSANRYSIINHIDSINPKPSVNYFDNDYNFNLKGWEDLVISKRLKYIQQNKDRFDLESFDRLKAMIAFGRNRASKYMFFLSKYPEIAKNYAIRLAAFRDGYLKMSLNDQYDISDQILFSTLGYTFSEIKKLEADDLIRNGDLDENRVFDCILRNYNGKLRDKLIVDFICYNKHSDEQIQIAKEIVSDSYCKEMLNKLAYRRTGVQAFNFSLPDVTGKIVKLSDLKGKFVFVDFWYTGCVNCSQYYQEEVSKAEMHFRNDPRIVFVTISIDKTLDYWKASINKGLYTSNKVINLYTEGKGSSHPITIAYSVTGYPSPMLIGPDQKILIYKNAKPGLRFSDHTGKRLIAVLNSYLNK